MADVFISYKREDREFAHRLAHALGQLGFEVWWDLDLLAGDKYRKVIREVIDKCTAAVVLWSAHSVESDFVLDEASHAKDQGKLCPARIDAVELPFGFGQTQTEDLTGWDGELTHAGFQGLVRLLEARVGRKAKLGGTRPSVESQALNTELAAFQAAQLAGSLAALRAFLDEHPHGAFAAFVRGQVKSMEAAAPRPPEPEGAPAKAPARKPRAAELPPAPPAVPVAPAAPSTPWRAILVVGAIVAVLVGWYVVQQQEEARRASAELAYQQGQLDQARRTREEAEERAKASEAKAQQEREAREQAERDRLALQKAEAQRQAVEKAERERAAREAEQQRLASAKAEAQRAANEKAAAATEARVQQTQAPAPFDAEQLHPDVRAAVSRARDAVRRANDVAAQARAAAQKAKAAGEQRPVSGLGHYVVQGGDSAGNEYAGYFEDGRRHGLGVYSYAQNVANKSGSQRYEGEFKASQFNGVGLFYWLSGTRFGGTWRDSSRNGPGILVFADQRRHEGEYRDDKRSGPGVLWNAQGQLVEAGIYADDKLTTALGQQGR